MANNIYHLQSIVSAVIVYDKYTQDKINVGYGCNHQSEYNLSEGTKKWFENQINEYVKYDVNDPKITTVNPPDMDEILISTINFKKYIIFLIINKYDPVYKSMYEQITTIELIRLMYTSLTSDIDIIKLKEFFNKDKIFDCSNCETTKLCFPKYSFEVKLL